MGPIILQSVENAPAPAASHPRSRTATSGNRPSPTVARTRFPVLAVAALVFLCAAPGEAQRAAYPTAPVRVIVGFPPGGGVDVVGRLISQKLNALWGQPVLVENRPGASSGIATRFVAGTAPDGYTVLINSNSMLVNQIANPDAGYDIERQLIPVINVAWQPTIIAAAADLPVSTLADVISLARKRKISYGTPGQGSIPHLAGAYLFNLLSKAEILHVPYKGAAPALTALAGNQIELAFVTLPPAIPLVKAGRVKGIAVTSAARTASLPNVPTVAESGYPGYEVNVFTGFFMPVGTPKAVVDAFRKAVLTVITQTEFKEKIASLGFEQADTAKENFPRLVADELKQWRKVVKEANIKIE